MVAKSKLVELAKHFNKSHHYVSEVTPLVSNPNHQKEYLKRVDAEAKKEMELHRRHRKEQKEAAVADED